MTAPWALVPVKAFARGKQRLGGLLDEPARRLLARAMFDRVVAGVLLPLAAAGELAGVLVVTDGEEVVARARELGASSLLRPPAGPARPLSAIVDEALLYLTERGAAAALVIMGDLPTLTAGDVRALAAGLDGHDVLLAPDELGRGTNALAMPLPPPMPTRFRGGDSLEDHLAEATARGLRVALCQRPGLRFDVDHPQDLARLPDLAELTDRPAR